MYAWWTKDTEKLGHAGAYTAIIYRAYTKTLSPWPAALPRRRFLPGRINVIGGGELPLVVLPEKEKQEIKALVLIPEKLMRKSETGTCNGGG